VSVIEDHEPPQREVILPQNPPRPGWMDDGSCHKPAFRDVDFFPEKGDEDYAKKRNRAKAACSVCAVRATCLQYALDQGLRHGIWGGKTPSERRKIRYPKRMTRPDGTVYEYPREVA